MLDFTSLLLTGCPFRHFESEFLKQRMSNNGLNKDGVEQVSFHSKLFLKIASNLDMILMIFYFANKTVMVNVLKILDG